MVPWWAMRDCDGDPRDAMLWSQITWWFQPDQRDGLPRTTHLVDRFGETWMYCTDGAMAQETGMSADQVYRARRSLIRRGLLDSRASTVNGQKVTLLRPIPGLVEDDPGAVCEEDHDLPDHSAESRDPAAESRNQETAESRKLPLMDHGRSSGKPARGADPESERRFEEHFWPVYPDRNGKKLDKRKALDQWNRLSLDDQRAAVKGARHYADSGQLPKDAHRWLRDRCWEEWQTPASPAVRSNGHGPDGRTLNRARIQELLS